MKQRGVEANKLSLTVETHKAFEIWLPLPPRLLSPNCHANWHKKHAARQKYQEICAAAYCKRLEFIEQRVILHLEFYLCRLKQREYYCPVRYCRQKKQFPGECAKHKVPLKVRSTDTRFYPRDEDNARASFKCGQDALVQCGILKNDSSKYVGMGHTKLYTKKKEHQGITGLKLTIEVLET